MSGWRQGLFVGLAALGLAGCASTTSTPATSPASPTLGIAVQIAGGARPTSQQIAMIYQTLSHDPTLAGYRLVDRTWDADYVLVAVFTPDALDPNQGNIAVKDLAPVANLSARIQRGPMEQLSAAQEGQQQLEAWAKSRESTMPRP